MSSPLLPWLLACMAPVEITLTEPGTAPAIAVSPVELRFEPLAPGEIAVEQLTVTSAGTTRLALEAPVISEGDFALLTPVEDLVLEPGETLVLDVAWTAGAETVQVATVSLFSDDPSRGTVLVPISGSLGEGELGFDRNHDFGTVELGCEATTMLTLESTGEVSAEIEDIWLDGSAYTLLDLPELPLTLAPGEGLQLQVAFSPEAEGGVTGSVEVRSDAGRAAAGLYGTAEQPPGDSLTSTATDAWPADLVFLVDSSCSMFDELQALSEAFPHLVDGLESEALDWRITAIDNQNGCSTLDPLETSGDAAIRAFSDEVFGGSWSSERLLMQASQALSLTADGHCNDALLRDDSLVHVVTASDEQDQSPEGWETYLERMRDDVGDAERLRLSAFVGPNDGGYAQVSEATAGVVMPLGAADLAEQMFLLAEASASCGGRTWIELPEGVDSDSVVVTRDGVDEPGFTVDAASGLVLLDEAVACDQVVEVHYRAFPECPEGI